MPDLPTWADEARQDLLLAIVDCDMLQHYPDGGDVPAYDEETGDKLYVCQVHEDSEPTTDDDYCPTGEHLADAAFRALAKHRSPGEQLLTGRILVAIANEEHDNTCDSWTEDRDYPCTCWKRRLRALLPTGGDTTPAEETARD